MFGVDLYRQQTNPQTQKSTDRFKKKTKKRKKKNKKRKCRKHLKLAPGSKVAG